MRTSTERARKIGTFSAENAGTLAKIAAAVAVYEAGIGIFDRVKSTWRERFAYTVTVADTDPIYTDVQVWLLSLIPEERHRALMVGTRRRSNDQDTVSPSGREPEKSLRVTYNDTSARTVLIDGQSVTIDLNRPEPSSSSDLMRFEAPERIVFTARTKAGQNAVLAHLAKIHAARHQVRKPRLMMIAPWGNDWTSRDDLPTRPLASVVLPSRQKNRIVEDLRDFLAAEAQYNGLAIPWHRGYLFHGPPGTGKTSLVKALAAEFNLDLWYISLSDLKSESSLMNLIARVEPRSLLLLEDIDTVKISHDRETPQGAISMSSLLNALDGVATPHGLVTIMTTNHREALDPALTRAGRMDVIEELGYPTWLEVEQLFGRFYGEPLGCKPHGRAPAMAAVSECFKRNLDNPIAARAAILDSALTKETA